MPKAGIVWSSPPSALADALEQYPDQLRELLGSAMTRNAARAKARMQADAPWQNQTGEARRKLNAVFEVQGDYLILTLSHGVPYGIWLELKNGGAFAVLLPTLRAIAPEIMAEVQGLL